MSKIIKALVLILLLVGGSIFIWKDRENKKPVILTPEELIKTMKAEKIETYPVVKKEIKPIFNKVDSLIRLDFYKIHAVATGKILMVYFYTNGCYYCEKMKNITFADSDVQKELAKDYIVVSINYSKYKHIFKPKFHLRATPAIIFYNREAKEIYDAPSYGYQGAEDFHNKLELLAEPF